MDGILYIVSTPMGDSDEITLKSMDILKKVNIIAAENIQSNRLRIEKIIGRQEQIWIPYFDGNEITQSMKIMGHLKAGKSVALISSAGTPVICDPGYKLIEKAHQYSIKVEAIGSSCAVIAALIVSGAKPFPFTFFGFLKNNGKTLDLINENLSTKIFFESSHRIIKTIEFLFKNLSSWEIILIKDLQTNFFQRITIDVNNYNTFNPKGQWVIVLNSKKD